jgi:parvin
MIEWINDELANQRIIVKDIEEDLYDGQVLQKLLEKLKGEKIDVKEVKKYEEGKKKKMGIVIEEKKRVIRIKRWYKKKCTVESVK